MASPTETPTEDQIRQLAAAVSSLAPLLKVVQITPGQLRRLTLSSQFERRTITPEVREGVDPRIELPELARDKHGEIRPPKLGQTGRQRFAVRGTVVLATCDWCQGKPRKPCRFCHGTGKSSCSKCGGSGTVRSGSEGYRKDCPRCQRGKVDCGQCRGKHVPCGGCQDHGRTRTFTCVEFEWAVTRSHQLDNPLELPLDDLDALLGDPSEAGRELEPDHESGQALRARRDEVPGHTLLFQALHEQAVEVIRVEATLLGRPQRLWLVGEASSPAAQGASWRLVAPELQRWSTTLARRFAVGVGVVVLLIVAAMLLGLR